MITLTEQTQTLKSQMGFRELSKIDHINQMITLTVITLSGLHCISKSGVQPIRMDDVQVAQH
jgi:hypothetical protein